MVRNITNYRAVGLLGLLLLSLLPSTAKAMKWDISACKTILEKGGDPHLNQALQVAHSSETRSLQVLSELVAIPSVSDSGPNPVELGRAAARAESYLREVGFKTVRQVQAGGSPPYVLAETEFDPSRPTVLLYAHFDVVSAANTERNPWHKTEPFVMRQEGDRIYGRGVVDDKGGLVALAEAARAVLAAQAGHPNVNIRFIAESEEEIGSPHMQQLIAENPEFFDVVDSTIIADVGNAHTETPTITTSLRGIFYMDVTVSALQGSLHSGVFGGVVPNAMSALSFMLGSLFDQDLQVRVPGFYDGVIPMTDDEKARFARLYTPETFSQNAGLLPGVELLGDPGLPIAFKAARQSAINIGKVEGLLGRGKIPPSATAQIALRVHPGMTMQDMFERMSSYLRSLVPMGLQIEIKHSDLDGEGPWMLPGDQPMLGLADQALRNGHGGGKETLFLPDGATLGLINHIEKGTNHAPIILFGIEDPDGRSHGEDEVLHLPSLRGTRDGTIQFISALRHAKPASGQIQGEVTP